MYIHFHEKDLRKWGVQFLERKKERNFIEKETIFPNEINIVTKW